MRGVFYRGDTREPGEMFSSGFTKRDKKQKSLTFRFEHDDNQAPDIDPDSAVCVTRYFEAAPLFPVDISITVTWVYVLDLDTRYMTNTQQSQYGYVRAIGRLGVSQALWPMYGQERAVNSIVPGDVIGAVKVRRIFNGGDISYGGEFVPQTYKKNGGYKGEQSTASMAEKLITGLIESKEWLKMPTQSQGIVKNDKSKIEKEKLIEELQKSGGGKSD